MAGNKGEAAKLAIESGVDIELPDPDSYPVLLQLVKDSKVSEAVIDKAVKRNLRLKFLLGLFENPYVDPERSEGNELSGSSRFGGRGSTTLL